MTEGRDGQPRTAFQQQNGWSLSPKQRMRGRTAPGTLSGFPEQRNFLSVNEANDDAPVSPGTKAPQKDVADGYFDTSNPGVNSYHIPGLESSSYEVESHIAAHSKNTQADFLPDTISDPISSNLNISAVAPWELQSSSVPSTNYVNNGSLGLYSEAWSGDYRPSTSRTHTSDSVSTQATAEASHKRSISERLRQGHLRKESSTQKHSERSILNGKKSSTGSGGLRSRNMSTKEGVVIPSLPKTPSDSREVTPWDYHEPSSVPRYPSPQRQPPPMPDLSRTETQTSEAGQGSRKGMFGHRHRNSRDDGKSLKTQNSAADLSDRTKLSSKQSRTNLNPFSRRQTETLRPNIPTNNPEMPRLETRATSPAASVRSALQSTQTDGSTGSSGKKPGLLGRIGNKLHIGGSSHQDDPNGSSNTSSPSYTPSPASMSRNVFNDPSGFLTSSTTGESTSSRHDSTAPSHINPMRKDSFLPKKESGMRGIFHRDRANTKGRNGSDGQSSRGGEKSGRNMPDGVIHHIDADFSNMEGIVDDPSNVPDFVTAPQLNEGPGLPSNMEVFSGSNADWSAPDSWAVKKNELLHGDKVHPIEEEDTDEDPAMAAMDFCIRVFRIDGTFSTLALPLSSSVKEILKVLGKKSFLQDELDNYQIVMRKGELQRELGMAEKPVVMQKRLIEKAGYSSRDRIEQEGQDDNSYLCRFTFVPVKVSGYYTLDKEVNFDFERMSKFNKIDLSGRSLVNIPIVLYNKAAEIISLDFSRNLALDVPRDFVQACTNLKEVRYTGNEARTLPSSFGMASKLQVLDVSHNQIASLEKIDLGKLSNLCSLRIANNMLSELPPYFTKFKHLRSLNLSSNNFKHLPSFFGDLRTLVELDISFNSLEAWPRVEELVSLERFWATNNKLHGAIPEEYQSLTNLKDIDVRFNGITNIDVISRLPNVEQFLVGHNAIARFEGSFQRLKWLQIDHNPITKFDFTAPIPTLNNLNLASNKLNELNSGIYDKMPNLSKLNLDKNLISSLSIDIGRLSRLEVLTIARNPLTTFPPTIGCLQELRRLDARVCNLKSLPAEIWFCCKLEDLNLASNVLSSFPKLSSTTQPPNVDPVSTKSSVSLHSYATAQSPEEVLSSDDRRPSQASSSVLSFGSSPTPSTRKGSMMSANTNTTINGRKPSMPSRQATDISVPQHKEQNNNSRLAGTFAASLHNLCLADNRLRDEIFDCVSLLSELKSLNLSYNYLDDIPSGVLRKLPNLQELYLSGNELSTLPTEDLGHIANLRVLHLNGNKFQQLPAELAKIVRLVSLDVGCNSLKYNVANWPYDWNWVWNKHLRYLNFSGNRRLEIKHQPTPISGIGAGPEGESLTSFNSLQSLRVLGLIDVTLTIQHVPDETDDRRVRTTASVLGGLRYGMADSLGRMDHLSTLDLMIPRFRGHDTEYLVGMFDGQASSTGGSRVARFLQENFKYYFAQQLGELMQGEDPCDALRRTFLTMNKDLITFTTSNFESKQLRLKQTPIKHAGSVHALSPEDRSSGGVATILFIQDMQLYVANVGNAEAILMHSDGSFKPLTKKHEPANDQQGDEERQRIRDAGGYVSRYGKLNDVLDVSRAFGYAQHVPAVMAAPHTVSIALREQDEMILVASKEFWDYVKPDLAIDLARSEREDTMHAAQKLRDLAIAFGASNKIMVMVVGVSQLKRSSRNQNRNPLVTSPNPDVVYARSRHRKREAPDDSRLALLDSEVDAPTGEIALVFTDIKSSTALWEKTQTAMRSAIRMHNELMRRQLRIIGGYEVKTEGDAFMIAFPTPTSALLWCFSVQNHLLIQDWPTEILDSIHGEEIKDDNGDTIYRGLSVRMGIHWGNPVWETDPITRRMDYFGPMVNRAARIQAVADGGEITCSADFMGEIERCFELYTDQDENKITRTESTGSEDTIFDDSYSQAIRRDLRAISQQGWVVKEMGERKLKGIENPEVLFQIYTPNLAGRQTHAETRKQIAEAVAAAAVSGTANGDGIGEEQLQQSYPMQPGVMERNTKLNIEAQNVWDIWRLSLRLEMICSALEDPSVGQLKSPETAIMERMRREGGEVTDKVLVQFLEHLICRIETCVNTLTLRNLLRPLNGSGNFFEVGGPMKDLFAQLADDLEELRAYRREKEESE